MPAKKKRGGTDTARAAGLKGVVVYFSPDERERLKEAAKWSGDGSMQVLLRRLGVAEAERVLAEK